MLEDAAALAVLGMIAMVAGRTASLAALLPCAVWWWWSRARASGPADALDDDARADDAAAHARRVRCSVRPVRRAGLGGPVLLRRRRRVYGHERVLLAVHAGGVEGDQQLGDRRVDVSRPMSADTTIGALDHESGRRPFCLRPAYFNWSVVEASFSASIQPNFPVAQWPSNGNLIFIIMDVPTHRSRVRLRSPS